MAADPTAVRNVPNPGLFIEEMPALPADLVRDYPSLKQYEEKLREWKRNLVFILQRANPQS